MASRRDQLGVPSSQGPSGEARAHQGGHVLDMLHSFRGVLVDSPTSFAARTRQRRWELFARVFPQFSEMTVLDLGGTVEAWRRAPMRPKRVVVINLDPGADSDLDAVDFVRGDACDPPRQISGSNFDLAFSNAVLEHVGGHVNRQRFAETAQKLSSRHWIQTPYRYFPLEPHWLFPGFQFLPVAARVSISQRWPLMHTPSSDRNDALSATLGVELVSRTEMKYYFPDSEIVAERLGFLTKSLIAIKTE